MKARIRLAAILSSLLSFVGVHPVVGLNESTHAIITEEAAKGSGLDPLLKGELGFLKGTDELVRGQPILRWVGEGGVREDEGGLVSGVLLGSARFLRHFHDPLQPWDRAGLVRFDSSVRWMQREDQDARARGTGNWSWQDARRRYVTALTAADPREREQAFADTFRALGQIMHLVVDASVPEHVRNDPHPLGGVYGNYEYWVTAQQGRPGSAAEEAFIGTYLSHPFTFDPAILLEPTGDTRAPVPVARLMDTDTYTGLASGPNVTLGAAIGIAEVANANFFSENTGSGQYPFPSLDALVPSTYPAPRTRRARAYLAKGRGDGLAVDPALAECVLDEAARADGVLEPRAYACTDENVWAQTAQAMLPRTVGYARGVLDYFFRGRLDVDLVPADPTDPSVVRLDGTNASTEALGGGALALYADDPAGTRSLATALDQPLTVTADRGASLESARFRVPSNAERFLAVYQGRLGQEEPAANSPGGVIGKVLGGVRVEELFPDGERWRLRTPKGVFRLPLRVAEFEEVRWGDGQDVLLARTPFGPGQPNRVAAYEVQRQPGSVEPRTVDAPDGAEVPLTEKGEAEFPFGMPLGTTVNFSQTIQYRQRLARVAPHRILFQWHPRFPFRPGDGIYEFAGEELGRLTIETAMAEAVRFGESFPIVLDLERHGTFGTADRPYVWYLQEVAADAAGRLLGVVVVYLTSPQSPGTALPVFGVNQQGNREVVSHASFTPSFPAGMSPLLCAVVDLTARAVVASTADSVIALSSQTVSDAVPAVYVHGSLEFSGGPTPSVQEIPWNKSGLGLVDPRRPTAVDAELETRAGALGVGIDGWLKGELASLGLSDVRLGTLERADEFTYDCGADAALNFSCRAVRVSSVTGVVARGPTRLQEARRSRPAPGDERLVFLGVEAGSPGPDVTVLVWDPEKKSARALFRLPALPGSTHLLGPVTGAVAMVALPDGEAFHLVPLDGREAPTFFPSGASSFTLLEPRFLYHVGDLRFYRVRPWLQPTALPARLADVPGNPVGDYHAVRLP